MLLPRINLLKYESDYYNTPSFIYISYSFCYNWLDFLLDKLFAINQTINGTHGRYKLEKMFQWMQLLYTYLGCFYLKFGSSILV